MSSSTPRTSMSRSQSPYRQRRYGHSVSRSLSSSRLLSRSRLRSHESSAQRHGSKLYVNGSATSCHRRDREKTLEITLKLQWKSCQSRLRSHSSHYRRSRVNRRSRYDYSPDDGPRGGYRMSYSRNYSPSPRRDYRRSYSRSYSPRPRRSSRRSYSWRYSPRLRRSSSSSLSRSSLRRTSCPVLPPTPGWSSSSSLSSPVRRVSYTPVLPPRRRRSSSSSLSRIPVIEVSYSPAMHHRSLTLSEDNYLTSYSSHGSHSRSRSRSRFRSRLGSSSWNPRSPSPSST